MAGRSRDTYKKRQKEVARAEKQREKAARRIERKLHKNDPEVGDAADASDDMLDGADATDSDEATDNLEKEAEESQPLHEVGPS
jgi:hypothetical protein